MLKVNRVPDHERPSAAIVGRIETVIQTVVRKIRLTPVRVPPDAKVVVLYARATDGTILARSAAPLVTSEDIAFELALPNLDTSFGVAFARIDLRESGVEWLTTVAAAIKQPALQSVTPSA
jgi:hypothetical protein